MSEAKRIGARKACISVADFTVTPKELDDGVATLNDAIRKTPRIIATRPLWNRRERCRFGDIQILDRLSEVPLGGALDAVRTVAEIDLVQVELENPILGVLRLDRARDFRFLELS